MLRYSSIMIKLISVFLLVFTIAFSSCSILGINAKGKVPKAGKMPHFSEKDSLLGYLNPARSAFDVTFYRLHIKPDPKTKEISGRVDIEFIVLDNTDSIQIDLTQNLEIFSIRRGNQEMKYRRKETAVFIYFAERLTRGEKHNIEVVYGGKPRKAPKPPWEGGLVWKKDHNKKPWIGVACEDEGAHIWWPMKDHISDEPDSIEVRVEVDKGLKGVSNGRLVEVINQENSDVFVWKTSYPVNTYNITFYVGDFSKLSIPYDSLKTLDFYVLPESKAKAEVHFAQTVDIVKFFEKVFGEYPWWKDGFKMVESPFAGMEHQTAIAYGYDYKNHWMFDFDYIILHETAHEWWGNSLTAKDMAELWLHEGFATYSEAMYVEEKYGYEAYLRYMLFYRFTIKNKSPLIGPYDVAHTNYKDGDIYTKGAWFLHSLRFAIKNDSLFRDILKTFAVENRESFVSTEDFLKLVNEKTASDYTWIFNQYLYQREPPVLVFGLLYSVSGNMVEYYWENTVEGFSLPVLFEFNGQKEWVYPTKEPQKMIFKGETFSIPYYPYYFGSRKKGGVSRY